MACTHFPRSCLPCSCTGLHTCIRTQADCYKALFCTCHAQACSRLAFRTGLVKACLELAHPVCVVRTTVRAAHDDLHVRIAVHLLAWGAPPVGILAAVVHERPSRVAPGAGRLRAVTDVCLPGQRARCLHVLARRGQVLLLDTVCAHPLDVGVRVAGHRLVLVDAVARWQTLKVLQGAFAIVPRASSRAPNILHVGVRAAGGRLRGALGAGALVREELALLALLRFRRAGLAPPVVLVRKSAAWHKPVSRKARLGTANPAAGGVIVQVGTCAHRGNVRSPQAGPLWIAQLVRAVDGPAVAPVAAGVERRDERPLLQTISSPWSLASRQYQDW